MYNDVVKTEEVVIAGYPPNIGLIRMAFPVTDKQVFAYYPNIYSPSGKELSPDLRLHEEIHLAQQKDMGADAWWNRYLTDAEFRYGEELAAFGSQLAYGRRVYLRKIYDAMLVDFSLQLSGELYKTGRKYYECERDLRRKVKEYESVEVS
jgi:hypothetical protein